MPCPAPIGKKIRPRFLPYYSPYVMILDFLFENKEFYTVLLTNRRSNEY